MAKLKDYNNLGTWLPLQIEKTGMPMFKITNRAAMSRATVYGWMSDRYRPDSESLLKFLQVIADLTGQDSAKLLAEGLRQYTNRPEGRKTGEDWGPRQITTRSSGRTRK